jgi:hypothetical protein
MKLTTLEKECLREALEYATTDYEENQKVTFKRIGTPQESTLLTSSQYVTGLSKYQYKDWIIENPCGYWDVYKGDKLKKIGCSYKEAREFVINAVNGETV